MGKIPADLPANTLHSAPRLMRKRAGYVDAARGFAIALGLFSHVMLTSGAWESLKDASPALYGLRLLTRFATPTFIVLFGLSMMLVYAKTWAEDAGGPAKVQGKLRTRALKCYLSLALIGLAGLVGGVVAGPDFLAGLVFLAPIFNADIFAFYAVGMVAAMGLIPLLLKVGSIPALLITLAWWPVAWLLTPFAPEDERLAFFVSRIFGVGVTYGPSVFHALPLVVAGMIVGRMVYESGKGAVSRGARCDIGLVVGLAVAGVAVVAIKDGPVGAVVNFVSATEYRNTNHFGYFSIGLLAALGVLAGAYVLTEILRRGKGWKARAFGGSSLLSFAAGNVVINLLGHRLETANPFLGIAMALGLIAAVWVGLNLWLRWRAAQRERTNATVPVD